MKRRDRSEGIFGASKHYPTWRHTWKHEAQTHRTCIKIVSEITLYEENSSQNWKVGFGKMYLWFKNKADCYTWEFLVLSIFFHYTDCDLVVYNTVVWHLRGSCYMHVHVASHPLSCTVFISHCIILFGHRVWPSSRCYKPHRLIYSIHRK